jgi:hypothetical protein
MTYGTYSAKSAVAEGNGVLTSRPSGYAGGAKRPSAISQQRLEGKTN